MLWCVSLSSSFVELFITKVGITAVMSPLIVEQLSTYYGQSTSSSYFALDVLFENLCPLCAYRQDEEALRDKAGPAPFFFYCFWPLVLSKLFTSPISETQLLNSKCTWLTIIKDSWSWCGPNRHWITAAGGSCEFIPLSCIEQET